LSPLSSRIFINTLESPYVKYLGWHGLISEIDQKIVAELELFANIVFDKTIYLVRYLVSGVYVLRIAST
jgi:hypothetical protein